MKNIINKIIKSSNSLKLIVVTIIIITISVITITIYSAKISSIKINGNEMVSEYSKVCVYISGAVKNTGVYKFDENTSIKEAINLIGGMSEKADLSKVDLDKILMDMEKIVIPEKKEEVIEEEKTASNLININEASKEQLMTLDGIGESTANKIIEYRKSGDFEDIEDIKNVSGIGDSKYNKIKDNICID